jgi:hypothetical protein
VSRLPPVRKTGTYDSPRNRRTVVDEYGAGPPEVWRGLYREFSAGARAANVIFRHASTTARERQQPSEDWGVKQCLTRLLWVPGYRLSVVVKAPFPGAGLKPLHSKSQSTGSATVRFPGKVPDQERQGAEIPLFLK